MGNKERFEEPDQDDGSEELSRIPVLFFCKYNICKAVTVFSEGQSIVEARRNVNPEDIPECLHGIMHSSQSTMPM